MTRILEQRYAASAYSLDLFNKNLNDLRGQKALLERQDQGSYVLKDVTKRLSMLEGIRPPGFYVTNDWGSLYRFFQSRV